MAQTSEQRIARRAQRKQKRQERRQKIEEMIAAAKHVPDLSDSSFMQDHKKVFGEVWPVVKPALEFAENLKVTGQKTDTALNELIAIGNTMAAGNATDAQADAFQKQLQDTWKFVRIGLSAATVLTDDEADEAIDKVIAIGDWITDTDETD